VPNSFDFDPEDLRNDGVFFDLWMLQLSERGSVNLE